MTCKVPSIDPDSKSCVECKLDIEKYFTYFWVIYLPDEFPQIDDCQVSYWNKVDKIISTLIQSPYNFIYYYSTIYLPLCDFNNQNYIHAEGHLSSHATSGSLPDELSFSIPVLVDDRETTIHCSFYGVSDSNKGFKCYMSGGIKIEFFPTVETYKKYKISIHISWETKLINCQNPDRLRRFISANAECTTINSKKTVTVDFSTQIFGFYEKENVEPFICISRM